MLITENDSGRRLDRVLRKCLPQIPISAIHRLLRTKCVFLDGIAAKADTISREGQTLIVKGLKTNETITPKIKNRVTKPMPPLQILFEKNGIIILNKPCGITCHGADSLESAVCTYLKNKINPSLSFKSGPLHRLDKPTSGIITFSTSLKGAQNFSALLQNNKLTKTYIAILDGVLDGDSLWQGILIRDKQLKKTFTVNLDGKKSCPPFADGQQSDTHIRASMSRPKRAFCDVKLISSNGSESLVFVIIKTGRTHQIRALSAAARHPLTGDVKYGSAKKAPFFLHAAELDFPAENIFCAKKITAPLPPLFSKQIKKLFGNVALPYDPALL